MDLALAKVPQILSMLNGKDGNPLTGQQKGQIDSLSKERRIFAGEAAVQSGMVTPAELQEKLLRQVELKAVSAQTDIATIVEKGTQEKPPFLKANWGNNGVNKPAENPTLIDASQSSVNIAQNLVMIANDNPAIAKEVQPSVIAATTLAKKLSDPAAAAKLTVEERKRLTDEATKGLRSAVEKSGVKLLAGPQEIKIDDFITARTQEIEQGHDRLVKASAALKSLDMGRENVDGSITTAIDGKALRDGVVGSKELDRLTTVAESGAQWATPYKQTNEKKRSELAAALDLNGDGNVALEEITTAAKAAGVTINSNDLKVVLETGKLPKQAVGQKKSGAEYGTDL